MLPLPRVRCSNIFPVISLSKEEEEKEKKTPFYEKLETFRWKESGSDVNENRDKEQLREKKAKINLEERIPSGSSLSSLLKARRVQ